MKFKLSILTSLITVFLFTLPLSAEVPSNSTVRLKDRRALRMHSNGYQMVDDLAEMQVTIDTLKRQVVELQDQLAAKNLETQNLTKGPTSQLPQAVTAKSAQLPQNNDCTKSTAPLQSQIEQLNNDLELFSSKNQELTMQMANIQAQTNSEKTFTTNLQSEIDKLKLELQTSRADVAKGNLEIAKIKSDAETFKNSLEASNQESNNVRKDLDYKDSLISEQAKNIDTLSQDANNFKEAIANYERLLAEKEQKISAQTKDIAQARMELSNRNSQIATQANARSRLATNSSYAPSSLPMANVAKPQPVTNASTTLAPEVRAINDLIKERDQMFNSTSVRSKGVLIRLQPLVSKNGNSLEQIRTKLSSSTDSSGYGRELAEIKAVLVDDINILKRLEKL
jgi:chromosome segregation ATPase